MICLYVVRFRIVCDDCCVNAYSASSAGPPLRKMPLLPVEITHELTGDPSRRGAITTPYPHVGFAI